MRGEHVFFLVEAQAVLVLVHVHQSGICLSRWSERALVIREDGLRINSFECSFECSPWISSCRWSSFQGSPRAGVPAVGGRRRSCIGRCGESPVVGGRRRRCVGNRGGTGQTSAGLEGGHPSQKTVDVVSVSVTTGGVHRHGHGRVARRGWHPDPPSVLVLIIFCEDLHAVTSIAVRHAGAFAKPINREWRPLTGTIRPGSLILSSAT
mmetsp:Transcript_146839/g.471468  ORF Transcript_146839/g.471468 Transcript_146839/m.471468 type:complete len:208 (+) Transcript_146839:1076-1699(+)